MKKTTYDEMIIRLILGIEITSTGMAINHFMKDKMDMYEMGHTFD